MSLERLYDAIERNERARISDYRSVITDDKETSTRGRVAGLCRRWEGVFRFSVFTYPEIVRPDGA
jgi:hypothetical protein